MNLENYRLNTNNIHNNGGTLYRYKNVLYKLYDEFPYFIEEKERNIKLVKNLKLYHIPKILKIIKKRKEFNGYIMEYISNSITFRQAMYEKIPKEKKISAIKDVYITLKQLHSFNICIGDIHMDNFLYVDGKGYTIDLDEIRLKGDEFKFRECYILKENKNSMISKKATPITDNIKLAIVCLSFYYGVDLETIAVNESLTEVKEKLKEFIINPEELKKIFRVLDMNNLNYLDDVLFLEKEKVLKK